MRSTENAPLQKCLHGTPGKQVDQSWGVRCYLVSPQPGGDPRKRGLSCSVLRVLVRGTQGGCGGRVRKGKEKDKRGEKKKS